MSTLVLQPTSTAMWHSLINEAETAVDVHLDTELESYLVFLLMRFTTRPELAARIMATDYLDGLLSSGHARHEKLRDVGDTCLLYAGLFPRQATRRRVKMSYFVDLGRSAYDHLGSLHERAIGTLYHHLAQGFVSLMDVLHTIRTLSNRLQLDAIDSHTLWQETGSQAAWQALRASLPQDSLPAMLETPHRH